MVIKVWTAKHQLSLHLTLTYIKTKCLFLVRTENERAPRKTRRSTQKGATKQQTWPANNEIDRPTERIVPRTHYLSRAHTITWQTCSLQNHRGGSQWRAADETSGFVNTILIKAKVLYFTRVARDSPTRLIKLWLSVRTSYPPSSVNTPFYGYSKLQLHGTEGSRNRRRSNDEDRTGDPRAQKATHQPTELRLLLQLIIQALR